MTRPPTSTPNPSHVEQHGAWPLGTKRVPDELNPWLFLEHVRAGIERLEDFTLDETQAVEANRLAVRLTRLGRPPEHRPSGW